MSYTIERRNDFVSGASLIVRIPENELDKKALHVIQADKPGFILPFHYRSVDGDVEFTYQIGLYNKLQHITGNRQAKEYAQLWSGIISPLMRCSDWFMRPYSFILSAEFLYYDLSTRSVSYVYVPTLNDSSNYSDLKEMAAVISKMVTSSDPMLENKVLRAIMLNFDPQGFLQMLKAYIEQNRPAVQVNGASAESPAMTSASATASASVPVTIFVPSAGGCDISDTPAQASMPTTTENRSTYANDEQLVAPGDIFIDIPLSGPLKKKRRESKATKEGKGEKAAKETKETKAAKETKASKAPKTLSGLGGLFNRNKSKPEDLPHPSAFDMPAPHSPQSYPPAHPPSVYPSPQQASHPPLPDDYDDATQIISTTAGMVGFSYIGNAEMPPFIEVLLEVGEVFTIGRYDTAAGRQQSSFEFERRTKAVSRRHAAVERDEEAYSIIDLSSSAGTFVDGQRLPPNTPFKLEKECRVSFGNYGADYVWGSEG